MSTKFIESVFKANYVQEVRKMAKLVEDYPMITFDTEYPNLPNQNYPLSCTEEEKYELLKENVQQTTLLQLGITFRAEDGSKPEGISTWEFNFQFDHEKTPQPDYLMDVLKHVPFSRLKEEGIPPMEVGYHLTGSGIFFNEKSRYIFFHGEYDVFYLVKLMTGKLPDTRLETMSFISALFSGGILDIKFKLMKTSPTMYGNLGLNVIKDIINVKREGAAHTAGSDSRVTWDVYFKLKTDEKLHLLLQGHDNKICGFDEIRPTKCGRASIFWNGTGTEEL